MFQVELDDIGDFRSAWRFERDSADRRCPAPFAEPLATAAMTVSQIVEHIRPGSIVSEGRIIGIEAECRNVDLFNVGRYMKGVVPARCSAVAMTCCNSR